MTNRTISGIMHVTLAVPFTVTDWVENGESLDAEAWLRAVNNGSLPDAMEGAEMAVANSNDHEVVAWVIESADYYEPETHESGGE